MSTEFEEDLNIAIDAENNIEDAENNVEEESEKFEGENNKNSNEDSKHDTNNESLSTNENSDQDDSDIAPEEINDINIETEEYLSEKDETEDEELRHITLEQSDNEGLWEDIYGRQRDKKGNIVSKKYVPPGVRIASTDISVSDEKVHRLERQLKGILNRLAEQNMHTIGNQVIDKSAHAIIFVIKHEAHKL